MKTLTLIGWLLLPFLFSSCARTIVPKLAHAKEPSYSATADYAGNHQTSGLLGWRANHDLVIDSTGRSTYNSLIVRGYGTTLNPPLTNIDYGLTDYTNDPVEVLHTKQGNTKPFPNPGGLHAMNPPAQDDWAVMTEKARQPVVTPTR